MIRRDAHGIAGRPDVEAQLPELASQLPRERLSEMHDCGLLGSLDIVELNPFLDHAGKSAELLVDLTASLFGRQIMRRATIAPAHAETQT